MCLLCRYTLDQKNYICELIHLHIVLDQKVFKKLFGDLGQNGKITKEFLLSVHCAEMKLYCPLS